MKAFLYATLILITTFSLQAQVGIGTTSPASGALLDLDDPNRGLLVPRVTIAALGTADPVTAPTTGLLVWNLDVATGVGFHYWNGAAWMPIGSAAATPADAWLITGNTNIVDGTHFIGTGVGTDVDVAFRRNNAAAGRIGATSASFGVGALANGASLSNVTAIGFNALFSSITANNTAVGSGAGQANTKDNSTFLGYLAGSTNTGDEALIIGYQAGTANSGAKVTTVGNFAGRANAGIQNTYIGYNAGALLNTGASGNNVAVGFNALQSGNGRNNAQNTAVGAQAMENLASNANNNTAVGYLTGVLISGSNNVMVGNNANVSSGSNSTAIGYSANCGDFSNSIALGNGAVATQSNHIRIGNEAITLATTSNAWTVVSDRRMKSNIIDSPLGLDFVNTLRPVSYFKNNDENERTEYGFIAQEVETALNNVGDTNNGIVHVDNEGNYSLRYNDILPITVKAVQEQQVLIEKLQKDNEELKATNAAILKRLEALEQNN